jgi:hypothetical protein
LSLSAVEPVTKEKVTLAEISSRDAAEIISTPMDAMLTSLACDRKRLHGNLPLSVQSTTGQAYAATRQLAGHTGLAGLDGHASLTGYAYSLKEVD